MSFCELRAARDWCEAVGVLLTPDVLLALALLANPEANCTVQLADTVRSDLMARTWGTC